jgi:hypothetical protein
MRIIKPLKTYIDEEGYTVDVLPPITKIKSSERYERKSDYISGRIRNALGLQRRESKSNRFK